MPVWSPNGMQVTMLCAKQGNSGIFLANSNGSDYKEITIGANVPPHVWEMTWSPDGRQLLYVAGEDRGPSYVYIMNIDDSTPHAITEQKGNYSNLSVFAVP